MRPGQKITLIQRLETVIDDRMDWDDAQAFFKEYDIHLPDGINAYGVSPKHVLYGADASLLTQIADDLGLAIAPGFDPRTPKNWTGNTDFRLFISHTASQKDKATRLKQCLADYTISGFVAHEDIYPTAVWQTEIERALGTMDAFLSIHTKGFSQSLWTQQEIGFAVGRGTRLIALKMGEDPTGFMSREQALPRRQRSAEEIATEINSILLDDPLTHDRMVEAKKAAGVWRESNDEIPF